MRQSSAARRHHNKRAEGFVPIDHSGDTNNDDTGDSPVVGGSSSAAPSSSALARTSSSAVVSRPAATTTTAPAAAQTTSSAAPTTSSAAPATSAAPTTTSSSTSIVVVQASSSTNQIPTTASVALTRSLVIPTTASASISSASASATAAAEDSGTQIGPLVGAIGGGLIGVIAIAAVAGYFFRRAFRKKDDFNRSDFVRNSVAINDDWNEKPPMGTQNAMALARANNNLDEPSANPRPPSMLERRGGQGQASYGVGEVMNNNTGYYGQQDQYYNYQNNGYYGQDQYAAGYDHQQYPQGEHPYAAAGGYGYTPPNEYQQSQLTRKPSAPLGAARGPGSEYQQQQQQDYVASPADGNNSTASQYETRQSVTPYQQQQYNEINKALNGGVTPTAENAASGRELSTAYSTLNQPQQPAQAHQPQQAHLVTPNPHAATNNRRSVYDEEDAYGGI